MFLILIDKKYVHATFYRNVLTPSVLLNQLGHYMAGDVTYIKIREIHTSPIVAVKFCGTDEFLLLEIFN